MPRRRPSIWLALSFSLLLGHTLLPHAHRLPAQLSFGSAQPAADCLWHALERALSLDLGEGHLEQYEPENQQISAAPDLAEALPPAWVLPLPYRPDRETVAQWPDPPPAWPGITPRTGSLRGPPREA